MKKIFAAIALAASLVSCIPAPARAGAATDAALALGAFAVFNQLFWGPYGYPGYWGYPPVVGSPYGYPTPYYPPYYSPRVAYARPPEAYATQAAPRAPSVQREVVFPHGRYVLRGDGVTEAYQWLWIPNPAPPPPTQ